MVRLSREEAQIRADARGGSRYDALLDIFEPDMTSARLDLSLIHIFNGGAAPLYHVVLQQDLSALHYGLMLATGLLAGLCGPLFIWLMAYSHRGFVRLKLAPPWQLALGGLIVGGLSLITPAVWGNGYSVVQSYLLLPPPGALLVAVFLCKLLAVLASSGSGAPGGVFTPTLFVGLAMGMLFARFSGLWLPGDQEMALMMGLTGMAAFLAATTHAPIMSTLMIGEMTGQYTLLPGLLITCEMCIRDRPSAGVDGKRAMERHPQPAPEGEQTGGKRVGQNRCRL